MTYVFLRRMFIVARRFLAASAAVFAVGITITLSGPAIASPRDQIEIAYVPPAGTDGSGQLVRLTDDDPVGEDVEHAEEAAMAPSRVAEVVPSVGLVVYVAAVAGTITIDHRPIAHLYMESMTMIFRVKDPTMLATFTPGDKIRFEVKRDRGSFVVTKLEHSN